VKSNGHSRKIKVRDSSRVQQANEDITGSVKQQQTYLSLVTLVDPDACRLFRTAWMTCRRIGRSSFDCQRKGPSEPFADASLLGDTGATAQAAVGEPPQVKFMLERRKVGVRTAFKRAPSVDKSRYSAFVSAERYNEPSIAFAMAGSLSRRW